MNTIPLRHAATVWVSSVDKLSSEEETPVQLCNYVDVYKNDLVQPSPTSMRATATADEIARFHLEVGDTVLTKDSEDPSDIGISAYVTSTDPDFVCGYHLAIARPLPQTHPRYLTWATRSRPVRDHFANNSSGISRYGLSSSGLLSTPIPLWSYEEQRRIADFLDDRVARIDEIIAARERQITLLADEAGAALADRMLDGNDRVPLRRLVGDERMGLWGDEAGTADVDFAVVRVADFCRDEFRISPPTTLRSAPGSHVFSRTLRAGDVLLERSGGTQRNPVGCPAFVSEVSDPTLCSNFVSRLRPAADSDGRYLSLVLGALYATRQQEPHSTQTTGIQNLNIASYLKVTVPNLSLTQQVETAQRAEMSLSSTRSQQRLLRTGITLLQEYKQSLITAAVTGELDVTTASTKIPE